MEVVKRKILLDEYISRKEETWGIPEWELNPSFSAFTLNIFFEHDADDLGIYTDLPFIGEDIPYSEDYTQPNERIVGKHIGDYYTENLNISGLTSERLENVKSYDFQNEYKVGFNIEEDVNTDYEGDVYTNVTKVLSNDNFSPITYVEDGDLSETPNIDISNPKPKLGIIFKTYSGVSRTVNSPVFGVNEILLTEYFYKGQGFNETNSTLSAMTKEEYLIGITSTPDVFSDVYIDRGAVTVFQAHLQLGEITNMSDLINYGNGYYNIDK